MKKQWIVALVLGLSLVSAQSSNPKADQISYIAQVQGALEASLLLHSKNDPENAKRLIGSASGKRWDRVKADLNEKTRSAIEAGFVALAASIDAKEPTAKYELLISNLDIVLEGLIPAKLENKDAAVIFERMLVDTAFYYNVGVEGDKVVAPRTHALAAMLAHETHELAERTALGENVASILDALEEKSLAVANSSEIAALAAQARAGVPKALGIPAMDSSNQAFLNRVRNGLSKANTEYASNKLDQAIKTMAELYLDGFEYLEAPISAKNPEMKEALEKQIGGDIPQAMKARKPASEVTQKIVEAQASVEKAAALIGLK